MKSALPEHSSLDHRNCLPERYRFAAAIAIVSLSLSCSLLPLGGAPSSEVAALARELGSPEGVSGATVAQAEEAIWEALRAPLRDELGENADVAFHQLDELRQSLLTRVLHDLEITGEVSRPPGLAQFEALAFVTLGLSEIPRSYASREDGTASKTEHVSSGSANGEMKVTVTKTAPRITAEIEMRITITAENGTVVDETAKGKMEIQLCPDAEGRAPVDLSLTMNTEASGGGGSGGMQFTLTGSTDALVNDNADFTGYALDITSSISSQSTAGKDLKNQFAEVHTEFTVDHLEREGDARISGYNSQTTRASSSASEPTVDVARKLGASMAVLFMAFVSNKAEEIWQNGYCVEIVAEGVGDSNTVEPASSTPFTARVKHKFEGTELNVPVEGTLSGEESLAPKGKSEAPVQYTYLAPQESATSASVALETRSKRGAAKRTLEFRIRPQAGYRATGKYQEGSFSGVVCSLERAFTITISAPGSETKLQFTPSSPQAGTFTLSGHAEGGVTFSGSGTYTVQDASSDAPTLMTDDQGCTAASGFGFCWGHQVPIHLVPLDTNECSQP